MSETTWRPKVARATHATRIPQILRARRKELRLTLEDVAKRLDTTSQTVSRLETGDMSLSLDWVDKFLVTLNLEFDALCPGPIKRRAEIFAEADRRVRTELALRLRDIADELEKGSL